MRPWIKVLLGWLRGVGRHKMVWVMVGGALGTLARYGINEWFRSQSWAEGFPWSTMVINVAGSFLVGVAAVVVLGGPKEYHDLYLLFGTGFCGGFTTFSTFELETLRLIRAGGWLLAGANVVGSVVLGFIGLLLGVALAGLFFPGRDQF